MIRAAGGTIHVLLLYGTAVVLVCMHTVTLGIPQLAVQAVPGSEVQPVVYVFANIQMIIFNWLYFFVAFWV